MAKKNSDPYELLGVPKDADKKTIKRAYRAKAWSKHPDAPGGSEEAFKELGAAYALLTDDSRREHFDQTGDAGQAAAQDTLTAEALGCLDNLIMKLVNEVLGHMVDPGHIDMLKSIRDTLQTEIAALMKQAAEAEGGITHIEKIRSRLTFRGKRKNLFDHVLKNRANLIRNFIRNAKHDMEVREKALELLKDYSYKTGPLNSQWMSVYATPFVNTTSAT